jgi:hypothetical protein
MNPDLQTTHKPDGSQHGPVAHRSLNEDVLQSAAEVAKAEVFLSDKATRFVARKPMKASLLALGAGALLALLLEQGLKRLLSPKR